MTADLAALLDDLTAEQRALEVVVDGRPLDALAVPTPAEGWTVHDQLGHLAAFDDAAIRSMVDPDGFVAEVTAAVVWSSSVSSVAGVSNAPGSQGLATSVAVGVTTITATDPASETSGSTTLTVTPAVLTALEVTPVSPLPGVRLRFAIAMGVRKEDRALRDALDGVLARRAAEIAALLDRFHVPRV